MNKFLIMFVMLLGSVATIQAQSNTTFDFSCDDNGGVVEDTFLPLSDGFSPAQMSSLEAIGYEQGETLDGDEVLANTYTGVTITLPPPDNGIGSASVIPNQPVRVAVLVGSFTDGRDDANVMGPFKYRVGITSTNPSFSTWGFLEFFNSSIEVNNFLLGIYFSEEEVAVNAWNATQNGGALLQSWDDASGFANFEIGTAHYSISYDSTFGWNASDDNGVWEYIEGATPYTLAELMSEILRQHS